MIGSLVADGTIALIAVFIIVLEVVALMLLLRAKEPGTRLGLIANGASGICLLLALYAALTSAGPAIIALCLALSFLAHLGDLVMRLRP